MRDWRRRAGTSQNQQPSANAILIAKQIVQLKGVQAMMVPIAIGVVEKVKGVVMQTNFMWAKDINEVTTQMHKEFDGRSGEIGRQRRARLRRPFHRALS